MADDVDIKHRDALAREMCAWGNPGGLCVTHEDHTGVGRVKEPCGVGKTSAWMLISSTDTAVLDAMTDVLVRAGRLQVERTPEGALVKASRLVTGWQEVGE